MEKSGVAEKEERMQGRVAEIKRRNGGFLPHLILLFEEDEKGKEGVYSNYDGPLLRDKEG